MQNSERNSGGGTEPGGAGQGGAGSTRFSQVLLYHFDSMPLTRCSEPLNLENVSNNLDRPLVTAPPESI